MHEQDDQPRVEALFEKLQEDVSEERGPFAWLRARPTRTRLAATLATSLATLGAVITLTGRTGFWQGRGALWAVGVWILVAAVAVSVAAALQPAHRPQWLGAPRGLLAGGLLLAGLGAVVASSNGALGGVGPARCLVMGLVTALPTATVAAFFDRRPRRGLAFAALAGGLTGTLAVQLLCPGSSGIAHQVGMHFGPAILVVAGGGALIALQRKRVS
ncbi:MAG: hypothetical protein AB8I08_08690 [Sandaracinaceae bacterium]